MARCGQRSGKGLDLRLRLDLSTKGRADVLHLGSLGVELLGHVDSWHLSSLGVERLDRVDAWHLLGTETCSSNAHPWWLEGRADGSSS